MDEIYLPRIPKGKWAISRWINGRWISLVQDSYLDNPADVEVILRSLGITLSTKNFDHYFPIREGQGRCPTLELLELCNVLDPTNPTLKKERRDESGV